MTGRIGFIGAGRMAEALISGIIKAGMAKAPEVIAADVVSARLGELEKALNIRTTQDNTTVLDEATVVFLAIKPQHAPDVLTQIKGSVRQDHLVVSIMAGVSTQTLAAGLPEATRIVRVMPNTPCLVGSGASAVARGRHATAEDEALVLDIFNAVGHAVAVDEGLMDAVTGVSGSGPAYVYTVIEALADGAVAEGIPRETALQLAAQTVIGAGKMVVEQGMHPAVLRDQVTSPAGTTAEGLAVLERHAVRSAFAEAVRAATRRSRNLGEGTG